MKTWMQKNFKMLIMIKLLRNCNEVEEENNSRTLVFYAVDPDNCQLIEEGVLRTSLFSDIPVRQIIVYDRVIENPLLLYQKILNEEFFIIVAEETNLYYRQNYNISSKRDGR